MAAAVLVMGSGCGGTGGSAPAGHTVNEKGVMHHTGLQDPYASCVACHGASLQGGEGPSCTSCHGVKW